jgi:putative inorganic carbon (hco3(-)) transporter
MRDFIVMVGFLGLLPLCVLRPSVGMMVWTWFAIMNPHREAFGFAQTFNFNIIIVVATVLGCLFSPDVKKRYPLSLTSALLVFWSGWTVVTSSYSFIPTVSWEFFYFIPLKVFIYAMMLFIVIDRESRVIALTWMFCLSLGYYGSRIGLVSILEGFKNLGTAGNFGPVGTMIEDRNHLSLAIIMILPLIHFLRLYTAHKTIKKMLLGVIILSILCILSSYSRGALISLVATGFVYILRTQYKFIAMGVSVITLSLAFLFMPAEWQERMNISKSAEKDYSWLDRVGVWHMAINIANTRPLIGGGFRATEQASVAKVFGEELKTPLAAHSVYMQVLSEHGYVGLFLFLSMVLSGILATFRVRAKSYGKITLRWAYDLAGALQASYVGYLVGAGALSLAYYDGLYIVIVLSSVLWMIVKSPSENFEIKKWSASK